MMSNKDLIQWIAVDWGTSKLRATAISESGEILGKAESDLGMAVINAQNRDFESSLLEIVEPWLTEGRTIPVVACGMVGAKQGWIEVPYESAPCSPETRLTRAPTRCTNIVVSMYFGIKQENPADVMRGEETQISGLLAQNPGFEGLVCLPGTHSKWVRVIDGEIQRFQTFLTGELFALLSEQSVLRHSVSKTGWDEAIFIEAIHDAFKNPESFSSRLFSIRAESLLHHTECVANRSRLAGIVTGLEFAGARAFADDLVEVAVIGSTENLRIYEAGLKCIWCRLTLHEADNLTLAGLRRGLNRVQSTT